MKLINLTPHRVTFSTGLTLEAASLPARLVQEYIQIDTLNDIPIYQTLYHDIVNLPPQEEDVYYIVSGLIRSALPHRKDLLSPAQLIRDTEGNVIGCNGLIITCED